MCWLVDGLTTSVGIVLRRHIGGRHEAIVGDKRACMLCRASMYKKEIKNAALAWRAGAPSRIKQSPSDQAGRLGTC
jgi:hypothetical protein